MNLRSAISSFLAMAALSSAAAAESIPPAPAGATSRPDTDPASAVTLESLEARRPKDQKDFKAVASFTDEVIQFIGANSLKDGVAFYRAAKLVVWTSSFRNQRVRYELLLAAIARGHADAERELPAAWDGLMGTLGQPLRLDQTLAVSQPDFFQFDAAPECIRFVFHKPDEARNAAANAENNAEIKQIVDADQAGRKNWSKLTEEERLALSASDRARNLRTRAIVAAGELHTAADFANASLVMQHSARFEGYRLAHELAVCATLLGDRSLGRWLVAATYDRMLGSLGHDQRFGTQYGPTGRMRIDEDGICDREREALGCPTLAGQAVTPENSDALIKELSGPEHTIRDEKFKVSVVIPVSWKIEEAFRWGDQATTIAFSVPDHPDARPCLYYRVPTKPVTLPATEKIDDTLRNEAKKKAEDRATRYTDYTNRSDSFVFHTVAGRHALSWTADYTESDRKYSERLTRIVGENSIALFFTTAPADEIDALRPALDGMIETLRIP